MAFKKTLAQRLFTFTVPSRISSTLTPLYKKAYCRFSAACSQQAPPQNHLMPPDGMFRRHLHGSSASKPPDMQTNYLPSSDNLFEKLREMSIARDRLKLDGLTNPASEYHENTITLKDAVKILKFSRLELIKEKLNLIEKDCVVYEEFLKICCEDCVGVEQGLEFAKMLDQSGTVIVLGNTAFLKPEKVLKAIKGLIPLPLANEDRRTIIKQLQEMEKHKWAIDARADYLVRRELWLGLGALLVQTAAFMRLTFWELSWDVMEPICFYVTSLYFMCGYAFFLRTSKEPSFQGFYQSRFVAKQKRLMELDHFDVARFNELKKKLTT